MIYFNQGYDSCWIHRLVIQIIFISLGWCPQGLHQCYILGKALEPLRGIFLGKWKEFGALHNQTILFQYALIVKKNPKQNLVYLIGHVLESFLMNPWWQGKQKTLQNFATEVRYKYIVQLSCKNTFRLSETGGQWAHFWNWQVTIFLRWMA